MKKKINLILLKGKTIDFVRAKWDSETNIAKAKKHAYYVESDHLFYRRSKIYAFVDVNARKSIKEEQVLGKSIKPELAKELDAKLQNKLDYLTERSFWEAMQTRKKDLALMLLSMGCGIGLYSVMRAIASIFGYYLP